jgi:hypothetical protein
MDPLAALGFLAFVIIGIAIIIFFVRIIWFLIPAAIIALIVFILTLDLGLAGLAFLVVVVIGALFKIFRK